MVILAIKTALENMDKKYCKLSQIDYSNVRVNESTKKYLMEEKYLERPFAYEFYHQLRKLMDRKYNRDRHPFSFKISELFEMGYSAVSQIVKRFEQKTEVDNEIKEYMQKVITALKEI